MKKIYIEPRFDTKNILTYIICGSLHGDEIVKADYGGVDEEGVEEPAVKFREDNLLEKDDYGYVNTSLW